MGRFVQRRVYRFPTVQTAFSVRLHRGGGDSDRTPPSSPTYDATLVGEMRVLRVQDKYIVGAKNRAGVSRGQAEKHLFERAAADDFQPARARPICDPGVGEKVSNFSGESFATETVFPQPALVGRRGRRDFSFRWRNEYGKINPVRFSYTSRSLPVRPVRFRMIFFRLPYFALAFHVRVFYDISSRQRFAA